MSDLTKKKVTKQQSSEIAALLLQAMLDRTSSGQDISYRDFRQYSKEYAELKGVSRDAVDMELTSRMLANAKVKKATKEEIVLAITKNKEKLKAYNHNVGDTLPKRPFFGHYLKDAKDIARNVLSEQDEQDREVLTDEEKQAILDFADTFTVSN